MTHSSVLNFWHGGHHFEGPPTVNPSKPGSHENGPGIYLTTNLSTATKYAKGGGVLVRFELDKKISWLEESKKPLSTMHDFIISLPRCRNRKKILEDLSENASYHSSEEVPLIYLMNTLLFHNALGGENGPTLAAWMVSQGVDASLYRASPTEDWVVLFNPNVISNYEIFKTSQINWEKDSDFKPVRQQLNLSSNPVIRSPSP